jgi:hypothetical protein
LAGMNPVTRSASWNNAAVRWSAADEFEKNVIG